MEGLSTMFLSWSDDEVPLVVWGKPTIGGNTLVAGDK